MRADPADCEAQIRQVFDKMSSLLPVLPLGQKGSGLQGTLESHSDGGVSGALCAKLLRGRALMSHRRRPGRQLAQGAQVSTHAEGPHMLQTHMHASGERHQAEQHKR